MSKATISQTLRQTVLSNSQGRCSYCQTQLEIVGLQFTIDHIIPESSGGETVVENLCSACWDCNLIKQKRIAGLDPVSGNLVPLFHPNLQKWNEHFMWQEYGAIVAGITETGRATVVLLRLNRPILVQARKRWIEAGWHPPVESHPTDKN